VTLVNKQRVGGGGGDEVVVVVHEIGVIGASLHLTFFHRLITHDLIDPQSTISIT
jgi:hypothetical protein